MKDLKYLHCLFVKFIGNVMAHVPDVAHAVRHHLHCLVLPPHHLLLLLQVHNETLPETSDFETALKITDQVNLVFTCLGISMVLIVMMVTCVGSLQC